MVKPMRIMQAILLAAVAALASTDTSSARDYRWCAHYGSWFNSDAVNCGFDTFQQCLATISGVGGTCRENPFFVQAPRAEARKKRRQPRN
jgi:hypothetical protein